MLKKPNLLFGICVACFFLSFSSLKSQDLHYSQFYNSALNYNPANAGIFNGDKRVILSVRDQAGEVPVPWFTFSGSYDFKIYPKRSEKYFWGVGFNYNYDKQGDSQLSLNNINAAVSYSRVLSERHIVTLGGLVGYASRGFDPSTLTWDMQWTGSDVNRNLPSLENFSADRVSFVESGLGLNYRYQQSNRTKIDIGGGLYHVVEPKTAFYDSDDSKLPMRVDLSAVANVEVIDQVDVQLHVLSQQQLVYNELLFGGLAKFYLNQHRGKETEFHVGASYRTSKYLIPTVALKYKRIYVGASYDIDMSTFNDDHNGLGGPEFHFQYILTNVKPLKLFKTCPIF